LLAISLLIINIFSSSDFKSARQEFQMIESAGKLLKNYTISRIDNKAVQKSKLQTVYAEKLEQLSNKFNDSSRPFGERITALDGFLEELQGEQTRVANELGARLESAGIKEFPSLKIPDPANLSSSQLEKLKGLLNRTLSNRMPDAASQNIEFLQELDSIEKFLSRIVDHLKEGKPISDDSAEFAADKKRTAESGEMLENPPDGWDSQHPDGQFSDYSRSAGGRSDQSGSGRLQKNGDNLQDGMDPSEGHSTSAGRATSKEENKSSYEPEKAPGAAIQDKMASSQAKRYLIHIRALTGIGEARLKEEEIFQTYRKEVESILLKEDIPINYREYIKNYFVSIGIHAEENAHEFK
jgi:hypothetical protein